MQAWKAMESEEESELWTQVSIFLQFYPSTKEDIPGILEPTPSITYDISEAYNLAEEAFTEYETELVTAMLNAWRTCVPTNKQIVFLDWQHQCYWLNPHVAVNLDASGKCALSAFPNGDYCFFMTTDLQLGYFGHPWQETICIWGQDLISAFDKNLPRLFDTAVRSKLKHF